MITNIIVFHTFSGSEKMYFITSVYNEYLNDKYIKGIIIKRRILRALIIEKLTTLAFNDTNANKVNIMLWETEKISSKQIERS